jgi:hypothetical protein
MASITTLAAAGGVVPAEACLPGNTFKPGHVNAWGSNTHGWDNGSNGRVRVGPKSASSRAKVGVWKSTQLLS